jgi:chemotaxis protein MotA
MVIVFGSLLGGFAAMGGHISVLWQPFEYVIILGSAIGTFFVANPMKVVKDSFKGIMEAIKEATPKPRDYLDTLAILYALMRELRTKTRTEMEVHVDNPRSSRPSRRFWPTGI